MDAWRLTSYEELVHVARLLLMLGKESDKTYKLDRNRAFRFRCGVCKQCMSLDCGKCVNCLDKTKFGGMGKRKRRCMKRMCLQH